MHAAMSHESPDALPDEFIRRRVKMVTVLVDNYLLALSIDGLENEFVWNWVINNDGAWNLRRRHNVAQLYSVAKHPNAAVMIANWKAQHDRVLLESAVLVPSMIGARTATCRVHNVQP